MSYPKSLARFTPESDDPRARLAESEVYLLLNAVAREDPAKVDRLATLMDDPSQLQASDGTTLGIMRAAADEVDQTFGISSFVPAVDALIERIIGGA